MAVDHLAVHPRTVSPEAAFDHLAVDPRTASPEAAPLDEGASPSRLELEAAHLPEACLLEYCRGDQVELLQGRVDSILRNERESSETRLNEIMETLHMDRKAPARDEHSTLGALDDATQRRLPALGMGLQRQQAFLPGSMLTEREQCAVRARRESCVQHLARLAGRAIGKTIRKPCHAACARTSRSPPH